MGKENKLILRNYHFLTNHYAFKMKIHSYFHNFIFALSLVTLTLVEKLLTLIKIFNKCQKINLYFSHFINTKFLLIFSNNSTPMQEVLGFKNCF